MKRPDELSFGHRIVLTFVIVLIILLALALIGWSTGGWDEAPAAPVDPYEGLPLDAQLLALERPALMDAYRSHVVKLFTVWLTDGAKDATHFRNGLRIARGAYHQAAEAMDKREQLIREQSK